LSDPNYQAEVGGRVRIYVGNGGVESARSFYIVGEVFDTGYPEDNIGGEQSTTCRPPACCLAAPGCVTIDPGSRIRGRTLHTAMFQNDKPQEYMMALNHAIPGEIVDVSPLGDKLTEAINTTLLRSEHLQVFRVVLRQGEEFREHAVPGEITVQCLEGLVDFQIGRDEARRLAPGQLVYLEGGQPHGLKALENTSVLVTIYHPRHPEAPAGNNMAR